MTQLGFLDKGDTILNRYLLKVLAVKEYVGSVLTIPTRTNLSNMSGTRDEDLELTFADVLDMTDPNEEAFVFVDVVLGWRERRPKREFTSSDSLRTKSTKCKKLARCPR